MVIAQENKMCSTIFAWKGFHNLIVKMSFNRYPLSHIYLATPLKIWIKYQPQLSCGLIKYMRSNKLICFTVSQVMPILCIKATCQEFIFFNVTNKKSMLLLFSSLKREMLFMNGIRYVWQRWKKNVKTFCTNDIRVHKTSVL